MFNKAVDFFVKTVRKIPHLTFKGWCVIGVIAIIAGSTSFVVLEQYTTTRRQFCMGCHYKQAYSEFWKESKVHPESVRCPECHTKHEQIIPRYYSADDEMVTPNCIRCHENITKTNEQIGFKTNPLNIKIPHKFHLEDVGAQCTDCHANISHDKEEPQTNRPRMENCFKCHEKEDTRESCLKCHYEW